MSRQDRLIAELRTLFEQIPGEALADVVLATSFVNLGFDSLLLAQAGQPLSAEFGVSFKSRQLLEDLSNIEALAVRLDEVLAPGLYENSASRPSEQWPSVEPVIELDAVASGTSIACASGGTLEQVVQQQLALLVRQLEPLEDGEAATEATATPVVTNAPPSVPRSVEGDVATLLERAVSVTPAAAQHAPDPPFASSTRKRGFGPELVVEGSSTDMLSAEQRRHLERLVTRDTEKTRSSKQHTQQKRSRLADPRTAFGFRPTLKELVYPLLVGMSSGSRLWDIDGSEYVLEREIAMDGPRLARALERERETVLRATPSLWQLPVDADWKGGPGFKALVGGELLPRVLAAVLLGRTGSVWNLYGPTESTVWSACHRVQRAVAVIPIGRPIDNTQLYVLDERHEPAPIGVAGELYTGGAGLALGYLGQPELTRERFVPFHSGLMAALPRTLNPTIDRRAPPSPLIDGEVHAASLLPRTEVERALASVGHSMFATRMRSRARDAPSVEVGPRRVFRSPTIALLSEHVEAIRLSGREEHYGSTSELEELVL